MSGLKKRSGNEKNGDSNPKKNRTWLPDDLYAVGYVPFSRGFMKYRKVVGLGPDEMLVWLALVSRVKANRENVHCVKLSIAAATDMTGLLKKRIINATRRLEDLGLHVSRRANNINEYDLRPLLALFVGAVRDAQTEAAIEQNLSSPGRGAQPTPAASSQGVTHEQTNPDPDPEFSQTLKYFTVFYNMTRYDHPRLSAADAELVQRVSEFAYREQGPRPTLAEVDAARDALERVMTEE